MKKVFLLMMVAATMLFTQCKKNEVVKPTGGNTVEISLTLDNNSKIVVNPASGTIGYEKGDVIYVAYNGKYVGSLTHNGTNFEGTIEIVEGEPEKQNLYFYSLGNKVPNGGDELKAGETSSLEVNIMDQSEGLPVISYGMSKENYPSEGNQYSSELTNWCALVKFEATSSVEANLFGQVGVKGMQNKVSVDLTNGSFKSDVVEGSEGIIKLNKVGKIGGEYWAVLLPQEGPLPTGEETYAYSTEGLYGSLSTSIQSVKPNGLYNGESGCVTVTLNNERTFNVGNDKLVRFAPGNLYCNRVEGIECPNQTEIESMSHFEVNQWDFNIENQTQSQHISYFVYGTCFDAFDFENSTGMGPIFCNYNADEDYAPTTLTIDESQGWCCLDDVECENLIKNYKVGVVNLSDYGKYGLVIMPGNYSDGIVGEYGNVGWLKMESMGAVFLPLTGEAVGSLSKLLAGDVSSNNVKGRYLLSKNYGEADTEFVCLDIEKDEEYIDVMEGERTPNGYSIRLVKEKVTSSN